MSYYIPRGQDPGVLENPDPQKMTKKAFVVDSTVPNWVDIVPLNYIEEIRVLDDLKEKAALVYFEKVFNVFETLVFELEKSDFWDFDSFYLLAVLAVNC